MIAKYPDRHTKIVKRWGRSRSLVNWHNRVNSSQENAHSDCWLRALFNNSIVPHLAELSVYLKANVFGSSRVQVVQLQLRFKIFSLRVIQTTQKFNKNASYNIMRERSWSECDIVVESGSRAARCRTASLKSFHSYSAPRVNLSLSPCIIMTCFFGTWLVSSSK